MSGTRTTPGGVTYDVPDFEKPHEMGRRPQSEDDALYLVRLVLRLETQLEMSEQIREQLTSDLQQVAARLDQLQQVLAAADAKIDELTFPPAIFEREEDPHEDGNTDPS